MQGSSSALLKNAAAMDSLADVCSDIKAAISDKPNLLVHEGGILREGYSEQVDRLRNVRDKGHQADNRDGGRRARAHGHKAPQDRL